MGLIFILLIVYQIKHFLADYILQGSFMLGKFKKYPDYIMPLFCHALVHFIGTWIIAMFVMPEHAVMLAALDGVIHFIVDRIKASPDLLGRYKAVSAVEMKQIIEDMKYFEQFPMTTTTIQTKPQTLARIRSNKIFWWCLGGDQMMHHFTHYLLIYLMVR